MDYGIQTYPSNKPWPGELSELIQISPLHGAKPSLEHLVGYAVIDTKLMLSANANIGWSCSKSQNFCNCRFCFIGRTVSFPNSPLDTMRAHLVYLGFMVGFFHLHKFYSSKAYCQAIIKQVDQHFSVSRGLTRPRVFSPVY